MSEVLPNRYAPEEVESKIYQQWEAGQYFNAEDRSTKTPFCIILPPPNVTGSLHLGHAFGDTIQDTLIRWKRMNGFNALWLPGTDHAGIATQNVVEKELKKQGKNRKDLGRDQFVEKIWEWKKQYGDRIVFQMKRLGTSCDWRRLTFTLDDNVSLAVRKVFTTLHKEGLIYQGTRLVNWCTRCETAVSDLEVDHIEQKGKIWHIKYPIEGTSDFLTVATTRPETMLGDTAVAVHPEDERYKHLIGKHVVLPLIHRRIPVVGDTYVDREFGSGVVKITPAHDFNDYEVGKRHKLELINILKENGTLNEHAGPYIGLKVQEARKRVLEDLTKEKVLDKEEDHRNNVGQCERCQTVIEPFLSKQWYVSIKPIATPAIQVVSSGTIEIEPESWTKTYLHWMNNIQDWCISRQLWWGHRIPAWYCEQDHVTVSEQDPTACATCHSTKIRQDEDVLDTWFSSALWPFSTLGWPEQTEALKTFYPTNVLVTGHDIIFFWVARMIMQGIHFMDDVPFRTVLLHGLVRDAQGKKMSKSTGNALDPLDLIEKYGADALRFTILCLSAGGRDLKFNEKRLEGYRNFMNKIWNAARFSLTALEDFKTPGEKTNALPKDLKHLSLADRWITWKLAQLEKDVQEALDQYRFADAANGLYSFVWNDFCDWYLEFVKPVIYGEPSPEREASQLVLAQTLNRILRLLHPMIPFITEEIYAKIPIQNGALIVDSYPTPANDKTWLSIASEEAAFEFEVVKEVTAAIRNIRGENQIKPGLKINVRLAPNDDSSKKALERNVPAIQRLGMVDDCKIGAAGSLSKCAVMPVIVKDASVHVIVPLEGLVDIDEEVKRLQKNLEKLAKETDALDARLSNENFVKNAPEDIIAESREQLAQQQARVKNLNESLARLQS